MKRLEGVYKYGSNGSYQLWSDGVNAEFGWEHDPFNPNGYAVTVGPHAQVIRLWNKLCKECRAEWPS